MRLLIVAALALVPTGAWAQFTPYGVTTYPGLGQTYGGYGAAPGAGIGYGGYPSSYGAVPGNAYGGGYANGNGYGNGAGGYDPYGGNAVGTAYAVPGSGVNGEIRNPDEASALARVRAEAAARTAPVIPPSVGAVAPLAAEKPDPKGQRFEGVARVIDGNTLALAGEVIVLDGADAPELAQTCTDKSGLEWRCGDRARARLVALAEGRRLVCTGRSAAGTSVLATCLWGTTDIGRAMVADGWAMSPKAVSALYIADESAARADGRGIWAGTAKAPWTYRNAQ